MLPNVVSIIGRLISSPIACEVEEIDKGGIDEKNGGSVD
jgi:hypothetical protein